MFLSHSDLFCDFFDCKALEESTIKGRRRAAAALVGAGGRDLYLWISRRVSQLFGTVLGYGQVAERQRKENEIHGPDFGAAIVTQLFPDLSPLTAQGQESQGTVIEEKGEEEEIREEPEEPEEPVGTVEEVEAEWKFNGTTTLASLLKNLWDHKLGVACHSVGYYLAEAYIPAPFAAVKSKALWDLFQATSPIILKVKREFRMTHYVHVYLPVASLWARPFTTAQRKKRIAFSS